jgi:hypothetical protein
MHATTSATMRTIVPRVTRSGSSSRASPLAAVAAKPMPPHALTARRGLGVGADCRDICDDFDALCQRNLKVCAHTPHTRDEGVAWRMGGRRLDRRR